LELRIAAILKGSAITAIGNLIGTGPPLNKKLAVIAIKIPVKNRITYLKKASKTTQGVALWTQEVFKFGGATVNRSAKLLRRLQEFFGWRKIYEQKEVRIFLYLQSFSSPKPCQFCECVCSTEERHSTHTKLTAVQRPNGPFSDPSSPIGEAPRPLAIPIANLAIPRRFLAKSSPILAILSLISDWRSSPTIANQRRFLKIHRQNPR